MSMTIVTIARNDLGMKRTFESLASQTYTDVEHIVVDGASPDGTAEWAAENPVFPDTRLVSEPDSGKRSLTDSDSQLLKGRTQASQKLTTKP